jgi:hypothetical protein
LRAKKSTKNSLISDKKAFSANIEKLKQLKANIVYLEQGEPFKVELLIKTHVV